MKTIVYYLMIAVCSFSWAVTLNASHHQVPEDLSDAQRHERSLQTVITSDISQQDAPNTLAIAVNSQALSSYSSHSQLEQNAEQYSDIPLSEDSWILILKSLSQENVLRVGTASKHLRKITRNIWKGRFLFLSNKSFNEQDFKAIQEGDFCNVRLNVINLNGESLRILGNATALQRLNLLMNEIGGTDAPALSFLTNLTVLSLDNNDIGNVSALPLLTKLRKLSLAGNSIGNTGIQYLSSLTNLTLLNLECNFIQSERTQALSLLTNLTNLNLGSNYIYAAGTLPLSHLTNLTTLNLSSSQIGNIGIQYLSTLTNLKELDLYCNDISEITNLYSLTNLTKLILNNNKIISVISLSHLTKIIDLYLNDNKIDNIDCLSALLNLKKLNLSNNQIVTINILSSLTNLREIDLNYNEIDNLSALSTLPNLKKNVSRALR